MRCALCLAIVLFSVSPEKDAHAGETGWRKIFELPDPQGLFLTIWADADDWVAAGRNIVVRSHGGRVESTAEPGRAIVGLASTRDGLFAVGAEEAILRLNDSRWVEEHFSPLPPTATRRQRYGSTLQGARVFGAGKDAVIGAYGPVRVLLRRGDHTWYEPPENDRYRLWTLALLGPDIRRPAGCARAEWIWLGVREGWFTCHGGRSFRYDEEVTTATGKVPAACHEAADDVATVGRVVYLLCDNRLWRSSDERWTRVSGLKDIVAIAGGTDCLLAVTTSSVWESCAEPAGGSEASKTRE
jgi:hypothetical protein